MRRLWIPVTLLLCQAVPGQAETDETAAEEPTDSELAAQEAIEADTDGSLDDAEGSIEITEVQRGFSLTSDVRTVYSHSDTDNRDNSNTVDDVLRARWRVRGTVGIFDYLRASMRVAGICSDIECSANFVLEDSIPTNSGMADGDITLDEAYLHWYRLDRFDIALGRMQTKFVARGGVFARSLDRNDSHHTNVNWTDGLHGTFRARHGWVSHLILQHNAADGATNIRRGPLDFNDSGARIRYFVAFENLERTPRFLQRGLDIYYLPKSLLKEGTQFGPRADYYGIVLRTANRWPERDEGVRLRVAAELGYAPETQTRAAAGLAGEGDADGLAWYIVLSLMDFKPNHSIGVNYGRVGAGWLLSPEFRENESLAEVRYLWRKSKNLALDIRVRRRQELVKLDLSDRKNNELDFFVRFTWGSTLFSSSP
jgi:hypothetical protein